MSDETKIVRMPGTPTIPATILGEFFEEIDDIKGVLVAAYKSDGTVDVQWSSMQNDMLCFVERVIKIKIDNVFKDEGE